MAVVRTAGLITDTFTENGTLTLPIDYFIHGIVIAEDSGNSVTNLKIGTTDGGEQVMASGHPLVPYNS